MPCDRSIRKLLDQGELTITGFTGEDLQPASGELHLAREVRAFTSTGEMDVDDPGTVATETRQIGDEGCLLEPGEFVLGSTVERVRLPDHDVVRSEGKSTLGRIGLAIHATSGFIDPGFCGDLTLAISNLARHPIRLRAGMQIGQMTLIEMDGPAERPCNHPELGSHYQDRTGPASPALKSRR